VRECHPNCRKHRTNAYRPGQTPKGSTGSDNPRSRDQCSVRVTCVPRSTRAPGPGSWATTVASFALLESPVMATFDGVHRPRSASAFVDRPKFLPWRSGTVVLPLPPAAQLSNPVEHEATRSQRLGTNGTYTRPVGHRRPRATACAGQLGGPACGNVTQVDAPNGAESEYEQAYRHAHRNRRFRRDRDRPDRALGVLTERGTSRRRGRSVLRLPDWPGGREDVASPGRASSRLKTGWREFGPPPGSYYGARGPRSSPRSRTRSHPCHRRNDGDRGQARSKAL
jgi:hypothetical protein